MIVDMSYQRVTLRICLVLLLLTINDVLNLESTIQCDVENGDDPTSIHRLTIDEKLALQHEILNFLGLPEKPEGTNGKALLIKRSAAEFLLNADKYKANKHSGKKPNDSVELSEFGVTGKDLRTMDESDVMITFMAQQSHQRAGSKPDRIWFDVGAVPAEDQMTSAELRLYRGPDAKNHGSFTVTAYQVLRTKPGERVMQLVDSANTIARHEGWITLNVTESLLYWIKHPDDNKGLYISVRPIDGSFYETRPEDIGIVGLEGDPEREPFIVGFFRRNGSDKATHIQSTLRSFENYTKRIKKRETCNQKTDRSCKVEHLEVSVTDLGFEKWIIQPEKLVVNYCSGECELAEDPTLGETTHARIQALLHRLHPEEIPKPCCSPTKLSGLDFIYYVDANLTTIIKRKWENVVVENCGCT